MTLRTAEHARCTAVITIACAAIIASICYVYAGVAGPSELNIRSRRPTTTFAPAEPITTFTDESHVEDEANSTPMTTTPVSADDADARACAPAPCVRASI